MVVNNTVKVLEEFFEIILKSPELSSKNQAAFRLSASQDLRVLLANPLIDLINSLPTDDEWRVYLSNLVNMLKDDRIFLGQPNYSGQVEEGE